MTKIITISREYGSGGRLIGKMTAEKLGIMYYDKDLIRLAAEKSGLAADYIRETGESLSGGPPLHFSIGDYFSYAASCTSDALPLPDQIHVLLVSIIRDIADQGPCLIVGRSADYILRDRDDCLNVFIHADKEKKLSRLVNEYGILEKNAEKELEKIERARSGHYRHYSGQTWGLARNYHISLDSGFLGMDCCADIIARLAAV